MKRIIFYIGIVLLTVYVEIMYENFYGTTLLAFEILVFAAMFLLSWYLKRKVSARLEARIPAASRDEEVKIALKLKNRGILPVTKIRFQIEARHTWASQSEKLPVTASIPARKKSTAFCLASAGHCGRYYFHGARGKVFDYLGLFSRKIPCTEDAFINVLPGFYQMEIEVSGQTRNFPVDGNEYDPHRSGDDPSEIFQIREFRDGDTLQRVHWKLSAKADELMTKELSRPIGCSVLVLIDFHTDKIGKDLIRKADGVFELAAAVSFSLQQAKVYHYVAWYDKTQDCLCRSCVQNEEQVYEMADLLLGAVPYTQELNLSEACRIEYPGEHFGSILQIDMRPAVSVNGAEIMVLETEHLEAQISGCRLEV
ncbi:DUF58 domain-containing protein [Lachnospiraceae bacterium 46-15]